MNDNLSLAWTKFSQRKKQRNRVTPDETSSAGFTEEQDEVQAETLAEIIDEKLATKQDLKELEVRLKHDLTLRLDAMMASSIDIMAALVKLL